MQLSGIEKLKWVETQINALQKSVEKFQSEVDALNKMKSTLELLITRIDKTNKYYEQMTASLNQLDQSLKNLTSQEAHDIVDSEIQDIDSKYRILYDFLSKENFKIAKQLGYIASESQDIPVKPSSIG